MKDNDIDIRPGTSKTLNLFIAKQYDQTDLHIPVRVLRGVDAGPTVFISASIHGDEIIGVEIIKRLLAHRALKSLKGTLFVIPIVNVFGFNNRSRYLPDGRDLNRSFPGSEKGSLASRMAYIFFNEVVKKCDFGIDMHSGARHRMNHPHIRTNILEEKTLELAKSFQCQIILHSNIRDGSLRQAAADNRIPLLLYEGGESLRFDEFSIKVGLRGILSVMNTCGMIKLKRVKKPFKPPFVAKSSYWVRATHSGTIRTSKHLGEYVKEKDGLGIISDPFGDKPIKVRATQGGVIIGMNNLPLVNQGDALFNIATTDEPREIETSFNDYPNLPFTSSFQ
jgi:predicted deacylase